MHSQPPPPGYNQASMYPSQAQAPPAGYGYPNQAQAAYPPPGAAMAPYPPPGQVANPSQANYGPQAGYADVYSNNTYVPPTDGRGTYTSIPLNEMPNSFVNMNAKPDGHVTEAVTPNQAEAPKPWSDNEWAGGSFSDKAIRRAFIKKVYLILFAQLLVTVAFIAFFLAHKPTQNWVHSNPWFYWCSYAVFIVTYFTLVCCSSVRRKYPGNFICLAVFTLAFSYMTGTITSTYRTDIVLIAAGITCAVCLAISLFAIQTKIDFTMCSGLIFALCMVLFFFSIACIVVYATIGPNHILRCVYGAIAALVFSLFLVYDTQMLVGGRKHELSPEEYIYGALQIYLDVVYLFLIILSFFGKSD